MPLLRDQSEASAEKVVDTCGEHQHASRAVSKGADAIRRCLAERAREGDTPSAGSAPAGLGVVAARHARSHDQGQVRSC